ncbi:hypothetical protein GCM10008931_12410 [Oceanobacillus oncorhynchi subsp. oncorhynchi]
MHDFKSNKRKRSIRTGANSSDRKVKKYQGHMRQGELQLKLLSYDFLLGGEIKARLHKVLFHVTFFRVPNK